MSEHPIEHNPGDHEDPVAAETWTVTFVGVILFAVTVLFVAALSYSVMLGEREMKVIDAPMEGVVELEAVQSARLEAAPHLEVRPENGGDEKSIVIPVALAIDAVVAEASAAQGDQP